MFSIPFTARGDAPPAPAGPAAPAPHGHDRTGGGDRLSALLDAVGRLADQQRSLLDALRPASSQASPVAPAGGPAAGPFPVPASPPPFGGHGPRPLASADDVRAVVAEALRDHAASAARDAYARAHLSDLPDAYRRLLPAGGDPAALAAAEQAIRRQFRDDLRAVARGGGGGSGSGGGGATATGGDRQDVGPGAVPGRFGDPDAFGGRQDVFADVGGDDDALGRPPAAAVDYAKLSPLQQIAVGLRGTAARVPPGGGGQGTVAAMRGGGGASDTRDPHEELFVGAD